MELGNGSNDDHSLQPGNTSGGQKEHHRRTPEQIELLELYFKECQHPTVAERQQLSQELGLEANQIKFWFQNRRTQQKANNERADNYKLRREHERLLRENLVLGEAQKKFKCQNCPKYQPSSAEEESVPAMLLRLENEKLKEGLQEQYTRLSSFARKHQQAVPPFSRFSSYEIGESSHGQRGRKSPSPFTRFSSYEIGESSHGRRGRESPALESVITRNGILKVDMVEAAKRALAEVLHLLTSNEYWIEAKDDPGRNIIHRRGYDKISPRPIRFNGSCSRFESSRDTIVVEMDADELVKMFLHPSEWVDLFPTTITDARTLETIDDDNLGGGTLKLMYEKMHILSPLVPSREFLLLRYSRQLDPDMWGIVDVSYDLVKDVPGAPRTPCWRLPSGCVIRRLPNRKSMVNWVEHVEVDDEDLTHPLFRDLVCCRSQAYGAERWLASLKRICERIAYPKGFTSPTQQHGSEGGVITEPASTRKLMNLSNRMVKEFCAMLSMPKKVDVPHLSEMYDNGIQVCIHNNTEPGQPQGRIASASASFWLPISCLPLFNFFADEKTRPQWDMLCNGDRVHKIHISCGPHPRTGVSLIQPLDTKILILQESCIDQYGALIVFAPIEPHTLAAVLSGNQDPTNINILPSGLTISSDGRRIQENGGNSTEQQEPGSLVTFAFQLLSHSDVLTEQTKNEAVEAVTDLITTAVQKIKAGLRNASLME